MDFKVSQGSFKGYSIKIRGCFERPEYFKRISRLSKRISKGVSRDVQNCFNDVLKIVLCV